MPGTVLGAEDMAVNKTDIKYCLLEHILMGEERQ